MFGPMTRMPLRARPQPHRALLRLAVGIALAEAGTHTRPLLHAVLGALVHRRQRRVAWHGDDRDFRAAGDPRGEG